MIETFDQLTRALTSKSSPIIVSKASLSNAAAGIQFSMWTAGGNPGAGATPSSVATPLHTDAGVIPIEQMSGSVRAYLGHLTGQASNAWSCVEYHDRLAHMGGLSGTVTTAQSVDLDLDTLLASVNIEDRLGAEGIANARWWMEWYTATGSTAVNATVNVTFTDTTTANLTVIALGATRRQGFLVNLNTLLQAADYGKTIRKINNVTLSATTGTAGNFGFSVTRYLTSVSFPTSVIGHQFDYAQLGLPKIEPNAALFLITNCVTTSTGTISMLGRIAYG